MSSIDTRMVLYVPPDLKERVTKMAQEHTPKTSASAFGAMLLELGLLQYKEQQKWLEQAEGNRR